MKREEELSFINRCNAIITSSLDIHRIYDSFIAELKKIVDVSWAAIVLIEENDLYFMALYSEIGSAWEVGERLPIKGTATQWVATHKGPLVEPDLTERQKFWPHKDLFKRGIKSIVHIPLNSKETVIGSFHVASLEPNAYDQDNLRLLQQVADQLTQAIENSQLYSQEKLARNYLERQSKERTQFIDALVHEVKSPLTAILASSELMAVKLSGESSPLSEVAQNLDSSAHHLNRRVAELLDFAKMQGTQLVLNLQPVDIREVVKSVANQISTLLQSKGQNLSFELPVSLPFIKADSERVAQVLLNLLINAIKFSPANTNISLRVYTTDAFLTLEVVDSAPPINPREAKLLFTPYYRSEEAKRTHGFGLGLSICKRLVELQGGKIWVHSQDKGNIFGFSLPQVASEKPHRKSSTQGEVKNENPAD